jgi:predicted metal-binding membrane protein
LPAAAIGLRYRERDYWLVAALIAIASAVAWLVLWRFAHSPTLHYLHRALLMGPPMKGSYLLGGFLFIVGWTVMTIAMMLPTSIPLIGIFNRIAHDRPERSLLTALVIIGYLSAWIGFGAFSYAFAIGIHRASLELTGITERMLIGGTLFLAGAFQFSSVKYNCLSKCRSPFGFVVEHWTGENHMRQAWWLGLHHGLFCVGCCWALMLLMVVAGAGNLTVMLALGSIMAIEKNLRWGRHMVKPVGALLFVLGLLVASRADSLSPSRAPGMNRCSGPSTSNR